MVDNGLAAIDIDPGTVDAVENPFIYRLVDQFFCLDPFLWIISKIFLKMFLRRGQNHDPLDPRTENLPREDHIGAHRHRRDGNQPVVFLVQGRQFRLDRQSHGFGILKFPMPRETDNPSVWQRAADRGRYGFHATIVLTIPIDANKNVNLTFAQPGGTKEETAMTRKMSVLFCTPALLFSSLIGALLLSGCGSARYRADYNGFNAAYADSSNHQMLLNLARLDKHDPTYFLQFGQISVQYQLSSSLNGVVNNTVPQSTFHVPFVTETGTIAAGASTTPSFTFIPLPTTRSPSNCSCPCNPMFSTPSFNRALPSINFSV